MLYKRTTLVVYKPPLQLMGLPDDILFRLVLMLRHFGRGTENISALSRVTHRLNDLLQPKLARAALRFRPLLRWDVLDKEAKCFCRLTHGSDEDSDEEEIVGEEWLCGLCDDHCVISFNTSRWANIYTAVAMTEWHLQEEHAAQWPAIAERLAATNIGQAHLRRIGW